MVHLFRGDRPVVKVAHRGALEGAADLGFDAVEVDVLRAADGRLVAAHDHGHAEGASSLDDALELLAAQDVLVQLDLKGRGDEQEVVEAVRRHRLLDRCFVSSPSIASLRALAAAEPELARALTYPDDRLGLTGRRAIRPAVAPALGAMRRVLPLRLPPRLRRARAQATTLNWLVVSPAVVARCHALGVAVYVWTVNDPAVARALVEAGTDGIITDDPLIFDGFLTT